MRRTKIVCTIGPATHSFERIEALVKTGMDVARLNFSHGRVEEHRQRIEWIRAAEKKWDKPIGILLDIQGPKIRLGELAEETITIATGETVRVVSDPARRDDGAVKTLPILYKPLLEQIKPGHTIYLDDGLVELRVESVSPDFAMCSVVTGGELRSRKGVSLPQVEVDLPALDENDAEHIRFGVQHGVDFVAAVLCATPRARPRGRPLHPRRGAGGNR